MRVIVVYSFAIAVGMTVALPSFAQSMAGQNGPGAALGGVASESEKKEKLPPPAAIPGAKARPDTVVPMKGGTTDLPPTEALFDAINRGDILTARDAISRGADLDSTNLLGLTPIELSVDLARNDISFLLLSLRRAHAPDGGVTAIKPTNASNLPVRAKQQSAQPRLSNGKSTTVAANSDARGPKLFAQDGGLPIPSAGFLGFDRH
jgi:hypothetical protein